MTVRQFSTRSSATDASDTLHDGVPSWMRSSINSWIVDNLAPTGRFRSDVDTIRSLERLIRVDLTGGRTEPSAILGHLIWVGENNDQLAIDIVDGIIRLHGDRASAASKLESILSESGSKWRVGWNEQGGYHLEERVDGSVVEMMSDFVESDYSASEYMAKAWALTFGRGPEPSSAYANAIKAVEAASWPVITPKHQRATLGTLLGELRSNSKSFAVAISEGAEQVGVNGVIGQMTLIWEGQTDRHGTANPVAPSQEAAEQATIIALSLCHQFSRGHIRHV